MRLQVRYCTVLYNIFIFRELFSCTVRYRYCTVRMFNYLFWEKLFLLYLYVRTYSIVIYFMLYVRTYIHRYVFWILALSDSRLAVTPYTNSKSDVMIQKKRWLTSVNIEIIITFVHCGKIGWQTNYRTSQYSTVQYSTVQYSTVQYRYHIHEIIKKNK